MFIFWYLDNAPPHYLKVVDGLLLLLVVWSLRGRRKVVFPFTWLGQEKIYRFIVMCTQFFFLTSRTESSTGPHHSTRWEIPNQDFRWVPGPYLHCVPNAYSLPIFLAGNSGTLLPPNFSSGVRTYAHAFPLILGTEFSGVVFPVLPYPGVLEWGADLRFWSFPSILGTVFPCCLHAA